MKRIIAILTQKGSLSKDLQENTVVTLFNMEDEQVTSVESLKLENTSHNHFSLTMLLKKVSTIYVGSISNDLKNMLERLGITIKLRSNDVSSDFFIRKFIFD